MQVECDTPLESFQGELQVYFRSRLNRRLEQKVMNAQNPGIQTGTVSGLHFGNPRKKCHSDASVTKRHREYYMGEGGGFLWVRAVVSQVSPELLVACPSTKGALERELTNLLVGLMQVRVSEYLVPLPSLIQELSARLLLPPFSAKS